MHRERAGEGSDKRKETGQMRYEAKCRKERNTHKTVERKETWERSNVGGWEEEREGKEDRREERDKGTEKRHVLLQKLYE